jgi:protoporphyrinogen oxidase
MENKKIKTLILGGGVTGISTASFLNDDYLILEKNLEVGGYCKTTIQDGFIWDYSGHFFHFNNKDIKDYVIKNIDCEILEVNKITKIYYKNHYIDFPFQYNIHQLPKEEFIDCLYDLFKRGDVNQSTFKSYVKSTLGDSISNKFIIPYNEKLYACDLNNLDHNSMGRFFPKIIDMSELLEKIKNNKNLPSYNDTFIYPINGTFEFVKSILKRVNIENIKTNTEVKKIDLKNKLVFVDNQTYEFENLVNTLPFNIFLNLCGEENDLSYNKVVVFNLGFDLKSLQKNHWVYFPGDEVFYRVGFYDNILSQNRMSLYVEIGLKVGDKINEGILLSRVLSDLKMSEIITNHKLISYQMVVMSPAYVHINKKSKDTYEKWCNLNNNNGIYSIGRYGSWTYCSIEDNIIEGKNISTIINKKTSN